MNDLVGEEMHGGMIPNNPAHFYTLLELLGEGSFCKVYRALYKPTNEIIAVKVVPINLTYLGH